MISKGQIQFVRSLERKKERDESGFFIAEGDKLVRELLHLSSTTRFKIKTLFGLDAWIRSQESTIQNHPDEIQIITETELSRISLLKTPNQVLAVIEKPLRESPDFTYSKDLIIGLDQVQDPGNVGTIIRLADWFGLAGIVSSLDSADYFSPKVVQASMGSIFRINLVQTTLDSYLAGLPKGFPIYATALSGTSVYDTDLTKNGLILMGNESKGLTGGILQMASKSLFIPDFSAGEKKTESLNVSVAAAIICSEFRRR